eukprot:gene12778-14757_t
MKVVHHVSYTSAAENLLCLYLFLKPGEESMLQSTDRIRLSMLEPVPSLIKLDKSVHQLQYDFLAPSTVSPLSAKATAEDMAEADNIHPIVQDILSGTTSTLSVMFRPDTPLATQQALVRGWLNTLQSDSGGKTEVQSTSSDFAGHLYWANHKFAKSAQSDSTSDSGMNGTETKRPRQKSVRTRDSVRRHRLASASSRSSQFPPSTPSTLSAAEKMILAERHGAWQAWGDTWQHLRTHLAHTALCGADSLEVRHHQDNAILTLPAQMLALRSHKVHIDGAGQKIASKRKPSTSARVQVADRSLSAEDIAGACFAQLIAVISGDAQVTRVALSRPMQTLNILARQITQLGTLGTEPFTTLGLDGTGVVIGISDTGIDETSCFFRDTTHGPVPRSSIQHPITDNKYRKVIQYISYSGSSGDYAAGHGSHVAGTVAGLCAYEKNNGQINANRGMASGAKIAFFDIGINNKEQDLAIPDDLAAGIYSTAHAAGARIHSNSWGGGYLYDAFTLATDKYLYGKGDFLAIFAAGNSGSTGAYTVNSPALSKNALAVACSNTGHSPSSNIDHIASFSSHGPALDGRIKPDITAPGNYLSSAMARAEGSTGSSCQMTSKSGTSMATPVVAGTAGLIVQYFQDVKFWKKFCDPQYAFCKVFTPSGILLKALLLQSGKSVNGYDGNNGVRLSSLPDIYQGYGRVNLASLLPQMVYTDALSPFTLFMDEMKLSELTEKVYTVHVTSSAQPLKVTLSWFDPPNEVFAARFLLHDLDLLIESPSGQVFYGNALVGSNDTPGLGTQRDEINNNEQVTIAAPVVGTWTVRVQSKRLTQALTQNFALVIITQGSIVPAADVAPLSPALLLECHISTGTPSNTPLVSLEITKLSKLVNTGWSASDSYSIVSKDPASEFADSGRFTNVHPFEVDKACVPAGCYTARLNVNSTSSKLGSQMSIPECGVYLSPMTPQQDFCIDPPVARLDGTTAEAVPVFAANTCFSTCESAEHVMLPLYLAELYEGAGWAGTYYTIQREYSTLPPGYEASFAANSAGSGSMDWGFEEIVEHCLPAADACYAMQLSIPAITVTKDMEYPVVYMIDTVVPGTTRECPFELNTTVTLAKFCLSTSGSTTTGTVTYYTQAGNVYDLGQAKTSWSDFSKTQAASRLTKVGTCSISMHTVTPPSKMPSQSPTKEPTMAPSLKPVISPTCVPTAMPSAPPTMDPSVTPSANPSVLPSVKPTVDPSVPPSAAPTILPSEAPTRFPTYAPSFADFVPTPGPSIDPTVLPTVIPSIPPSAFPTEAPSVAPSVTATAVPTATPSAIMTNPPTNVPVAAPSAQPSQPVAESLLRIYGNTSFSCLSDCAGYPGPEGLVNDMEATCYFLLDVFHLCSTYAVAYGLCERPACAADCSMQEWCCFGGGTVVSCPEMLWKGQSTDAMRIVDQCVTSVNATVNGFGDDEDAGGDAQAKGMSAAAKTAMIIFVVLITIAAIIGANFCLIAWRKGANTHDQLPTESQHSLFSSSSSEHGENASTHGMPSLEDGRASSPRGGPSGLSADRMKGLLVRSASYLKDRVGRRSSSRGANSKPSSGNRGSNKGTEEYAAVRSPFSIDNEGDDEGDEEDQETKNSVDDEYIRV